MPDVTYPFRDDNHIRSYMTLVKDSLYMNWVADQINAKYPPSN